MSPPTTAPGRILAVLDNDGSHTALEAAAALAERHGATLEAFACAEPPDDLTLVAQLSGQNRASLIRQLVDHRRAAAEAQLKNADLLGPAPTLHVAVGKAFLEIIKCADRTQSDFVVKTAEPLAGVERFLFASTDQHLLRKCPCPVWLQTAGAPRLPRRILAAVDLDVADAAEPDTLTGLNRRVIETARRIADGPGAEIIVLHAWDAAGEGMVWAFTGGPDARLSADLYVNELLDARHAAMARFLTDVEQTRPTKTGPRLVAHLAKGAPERVIREQSRALAADVVVMGTVARTGLSGVFIGNTAENIINSLDCPVIAVKPDGFVSPLLGG